MMASGTSLETVVVLIPGLQVSDHDHGLNHIIVVTKAKSIGVVVGTRTVEYLEVCRTVKNKRKVVSAAINVAFREHPDFDGTIKYTAQDDGKPTAKGIEVFTSGLRNPYTLVLHSHGKMYASDSGLIIGFGRIM
jgi:glucose/arabinose dehydrogenase